MKKLVIILLVLSLSILALAACGGGGNGESGGGNADSEKSTEGLVFEKDSLGNYTVKKYTGTDTEVYIPAKHEDTPVTSIARDAFKANLTVTAVHIPESVIKIDVKAFENCKNLTSVKFNAEPASLEIANGAFGGCAALAELVLPDATQKIGVNAFNGCTKLISTSSDCTYVGNWLINADKNLSTLTLKSTTVGIADQSFSWSSTLSSVSLPSTVRYLGDGAFRGCSELLSVKINADSALVRVGDEAFASCQKLTSLSFPAGVSYIGDSFLEECVKMESISVAQGCERYASHDNALLIDKETKTLFYTINKANISIPSDGSVEYIGEGAFYERTELQAVTIPASVKEIGEKAFYGCKALATVTVSDNSNLVKICEQAFSKASALHTFNLGANTKLEEISKGAFSYTRLGAFTLPATIKALGEQAFAFCYHIKSLNFAEGYSLTVIPDELLINCSSLTSITLPECNVEIGYQAFRGSHQLASIVIPESVTKIDSKAFGTIEGGTAVMTKLYCEADEKPAGWAENWYTDDLEVTWGYTA